MWKSCYERSANVAAGCCPNRPGNGLSIRSTAADPRWYVEPETTTGGSLLHIRDSRFGWLHYTIPRKEARKLGEYLIAQSGSQAAE